MDKRSERNIFCKASDREDVSGVMVYYAAVYVEFLVSIEILTGIFSPWEEGRDGKLS